MTEHSSLSSAQPVEKEDSFVTALSFPSSRPTIPAAKMFSITDTSPASPMIKHRPNHAEFKFHHDKKQVGTPHSCTSAITESPQLSQTTTNRSARSSRPHSYVHFDATSTALSLGPETPVPSRNVLPHHDTRLQKETESTPKNSASRVADPLDRALTPVDQGRTKAAQSASFNECEPITPKSATDFCTSEKPLNSVTDNFTPPPSRIPTSRRRTPGYARSTKASRRRSEVRSELLLASQKKHDNTAKSIGFTKTIPKSPEVLHRKLARTRKGSPRRRTSFKAKPVPRYLTMPRPVVRPTAKSEAILHGPTSSAPVPTALAVCNMSPTVPEPFKLASVELHEARMMKIHSKRKAEQEEAEKRRVLHPTPLNRKMLEGPMFVPCLDKKNLTDPVDLLPWAAERRERTLAYEAAQRARVEEMEAMKEIVRKQRELAEEEKMREDYERKRFRPRPVPRSHYFPDTPPNRKASIAVMRIKEDIARRMECEEVELESVFSTLVVTETEETRDSLKYLDNAPNQNALSCTPSNIARDVGNEKSFPTEREVLHERERSEENHIVDAQLGSRPNSPQKNYVNEVDKENYIPSGQARPKDCRRRGSEHFFAPLKLFHEIRTTLLGGY